MLKQRVGLIILDGLGVSKSKKGNAFKLARTPTIDSLLKRNDYCLLQASQQYVGLPKNQPGNSEIGHLTIGAGRVILSPLVWLDKKFASSQIFNDIFFINLKKKFISKDKKLHLFGLFSNGKVHSSSIHILKIVDFCIKNKIKTAIHLFSDGRDVSTDSFKTDLLVLLKKIQKYDYINLASISGRYYSMDRDNRWERTSLFIDTLINKVKNYFSDPIKYVKKQLELFKSDEFILPAINANIDFKDICLDKNDIVFICNFRADRVRQLAHCFKKSNLYNYNSKLWPLNLQLLTLTEYDGIQSDNVFYKKNKIKHTLGWVISSNKYKQLRIAETEKYAHVTYFFDGGSNIKFNYEKQILINSPKVKFYDQKPEMSANKIADKLINNMHKFDFFVCNFANCDMVGHTGNLKKTIIAVETVDNCLKKILNKARLQKDLTIFITADHGNCECMIDNKNKIVTSHTTNPVFFVSNRNIKFIHKTGTLANIAPTIIKLMNIQQPKEMNNKPLC